MPTAAMPTVIDGIVTQLSIARKALHLNVGGVTHEESLQRPDPGANCINWVVGHMLSSRNGVLAATGGERVVAKERLAPYARGTSGDVAEPIPIEELLDLFDRTHEPLVAALQTLTDEQLNARSPFNSPAGPYATLAQALAAVTLHECYHVGQLGMARRLVGKKGAI